MFSGYGFERNQRHTDTSTIHNMMPEHGVVCPSCNTPFDTGRHRKLIDSCGHEICYMCISADHCPLCVYKGRISHASQVKKLLRHQRNLRLPRRQYVDNQTAFSDDESHAEAKVYEDHNLHMRLGLLLGDHMSLTNRNGHYGNCSSQESYASISSLASSEANTTDTSPLSTLTDSSDIDHLSHIPNRYVPHRKESSDSVVSLMSSKTGRSSSSNLCGFPFQRHIPARTSDSFVQLSRRNFYKRQAHHKSDDSHLNFSDLGRRTNASKLLNKFLNPLYFEIPQIESCPVFVGRQWLFKEIEQEITSNYNRNKAIVLMGGPGSGKTAIVSQIIEQSSFRIKKEDAIYNDIQSLDGSDYMMSNSSSSDSGLYQSIPSLHHSALRSLGNRLVAYHLCQTDNNITCLVPEFVHSIAAHLCRAPQLTAYRDLVARDVRLQEHLSLSRCIADSNTSFIRGVLQPLHSLRRQNKIPNTTCVLIIDGLNEAEFHRPDYGDTISSFITSHIEKFPLWLKVIITIRTAFIDIIKQLPSHCISLDKVSASENLQKDMCSYIIHRINTSPTIRSNITVHQSKVEGSSNSRFAMHLTNLSKGSTLFVRLTLDLIEKGNLVVKSSSYRVLPVSLNELYTLSFNLKFTTVKSFDKVTPILQICLATLSPLSLQEIYHILNAMKVSCDIPWEDFLERMDVLFSGHFIVTRQDGTIMFAHPSMREWLLRRDENESTKFLCDVRTGHAAVAFYMSRLNRKFSAEDWFVFGHHVLKAHIYKSAYKSDLYQCLPRDIQAYWVHLGDNCIESALMSIRNIYSPNVKVSRLLLLSGASPHYKILSESNLPLLASAIFHNFFDMASLLIEFGADVNATSNYGIGSLALACKTGNLELVRLLLSNGAKIDQVDNEGNCPMVHAALNGHLNIIMHLTQCDWPMNEGMNELSYSAQRSLVVAAVNGHPDVCEFLLDMPEVKVNNFDDLIGHTALTAASAAGHLHTCLVLLRRGATVMSKNKRHEIPLLCASIEGHWEVAELLLMHGAPMEYTDDIGRTALILAAMNGQPVVELLLSKGANPEASDNEGLTALSWACLKGQYHSVQCLLSHRCNVNNADKSGRTPLDFAAVQGDPEIVQLLLDSGAIMEHFDLAGLKPLDRAISCRNIAAICQFLYHGAKLVSQTWAMAQGSAEILALLLSKLLEDAAVLCKRGKLKDAVMRYQYALKKFPPETNIENEAQFQQIKFQLYLGLSRCKRKLNESKHSLEAAEQAIAVKPKSFEGYYSRARAYESLGFYERALDDVKDALKFAPENNDLKQILIHLKEQILSTMKSNSCTSEKSEDYIGFTGTTEIRMEDFGSTETIDQLCNMTMNLVADLNHLKDKMQDSGCESAQ